MASHEAQESKWKTLSAGRTGFLTNDIFDLNAGDPTSATNGGGTYPWAMESYLGRINYNYDNRYIVDRLLSEEMVQPILVLRTDGELFHLFQQHGELARRNSLMLLA